MELRPPPHGASHRRAPSSETELMLASACRHPGPPEVNRAHGAMSLGGGAPINWEGFVPLAQRHGVLPLLYRHLSTHAFDARLVPASALARLREGAERAARRSLMLTGELVSLLGELERAGIRVVPLKGPVLAQQLYGSPALRRMNDLDLLVAEEDVDRAATLIVELGFCVEPSWGSAALGGVHRDVKYHVELVSAAKPCRVELHYGVDQPFGGRRQTLATIESELESISIFGRPVWVMRPEMLLTYLCVHGGKHLWERIEWIGGIAELLRGGRISDWDRVRASARRLRAERAVRSALYLVQELFDAPVPATELRGDRSARAAARSVAKRLGSDPNTIPGTATRLFHHVRIDTGIRNRAARVWAALFVATLGERAAVPLPRALAPVYHLLRPASILIRRIGRWAASR